MPPARAPAEDEGRSFVARQDRRVIVQIVGDAPQEAPQEAPHRRTFPFFLLRLPGDHKELVTPPPAHPIPLAHVALQYFGEAYKAGVPGVMTVLVVDRLEFVEVHQRQLERPPSASGPGHVSGKALLCSPAVVEARA